MELKFTEDQMIEALKANGYIVQEIPSWIREPRYHNDMDYKDCKVMVALKPGEEIPEASLKREVWYIKSEWGIEHRFLQLLHSKVYQLLIGGSDVNKN